MTDHESQLQECANEHCVNGDVAQPADQWVSPALGVFCSQQCAALALDVEVERLVADRPRVASEAVEKVRKAIYRDLKGRSDMAHAKAREHTAAANLLTELAYGIEGARIGSLTENNGSRSHR